jgi:hypothetical protein
MGALYSRTVSASTALHIPHHSSRMDHLIDFIWDGGGALLISGAIRYSIWPPGRHLGFRISDCNCRTGRPIDFIFLWHRGVGWGTCPIDFGRDLIFNIAVWQTSWILYSGPLLQIGSPDWFHIPDCNCRMGRQIDFIFLWHSGVGWGRCPIDFGCDPILNPIWPSGGHS